MAHPPVYLHALKQLQMFTSTPLPDALQYTAQEYMNKELYQPETLYQFLKEVQVLTDSIIKIDQVFERVKTDLGRIDDCEFIGKRFEIFRPHWVALQHRFIAHIWISQKSARQAAAYAKEFASIILPGLEEIKSAADHRVAVAELNEFTARPDPFRQMLDSMDAPEHTHKHSKALNDLRSDIKSFRERFDLFAEDQGANMPKELVDLRQSMNRSKLDLKR
ncbi:hypothetical protein H0H81_008986 [Sphagnurus paluster]|uniref:Uncharacterized protein n=1 Tax=Sphagnurus paluster TaxID=117069 RepID=A0A9P7FRV3_9AGAR|nr:hypothetical protein H0H81_008986 [Sphagnurus paluster]